MGGYSQAKAHSFQDRNADRKLRTVIDSMGARCTLFILAAAAAISFSLAAYLNFDTHRHLDREGTTSQVY
jgi:hypothetical protein